MDVEQKKSAFHSEDARWPIYCLILLAMVWIWAAINPFDRLDWILENILTIILIAILFLTYKKFRLSNISYTLIFIFLVMHTIGSHYTYANTPILNWLWNLMGASRNHYDRVVHFSFGLLLSYPIREIFIRITAVKGFWGYYLPFDVTASFSAIYELIEYLAATAVSPELGAAYLGTQGDVLDAQKDMMLAILGSIIAMCVVAFVNYRKNKKFGKEMSNSFSVKIHEPLGEVKLEEYADKKDAVDASNKKTYARIIIAKKKSKNKNIRKSKR